MYRKEILGSVVMLLIFGSAYYMTLSMNVRSGGYPQMITIAGLIMTAIKLGRAIYRSKKNIPIDMPAAMSWEQIMAASATLAAAFAYIIAVSYVGYATVTFLFATVSSYCLSTHTKVYSKLWVYPAVGFGTTVALYIVFGVLLNVPLPRGILI